MNPFGTNIRLATAADTGPIRDELFRRGGFLFVPSHVVERDGQTLGAISLGTLPLVALWLKEEARIRDTIQLHRFIEATMIERLRVGSAPPCYATVMEKESPINQFMERAGHLKLGSVEMYIKPLCQ